jgi:methylenetetrahydrofolate dehydrogenase (NADP+)/methenyltetrahydrofolate cyclohydrolase
MPAGWQWARTGLVPCTPWGCLMLLKDRLATFPASDAVVIGRSNIVGKPMAQLLLLRIAP